MTDGHLPLVGIIISLVSLGVTVFIAFYIRYLDRKQRERDESFYVTATMKDIQQLKEHLINIHNISESEDPIADTDEQIEISQRLADYTDKNKKLMESLINDTRFSMSRWMNLDDEGRKNVEQFIETTTWVLSDYLPKPNESQETQIRRWQTYLEEFQKRKNESSKKIESLELRYS